MITAIRIVLLVFSALFYLASLGAKSEKQMHFDLTAGTVTTVLLLLSMKLL